MNRDRIESSMDAISSGKPTKTRRHRLIWGIAAAIAVIALIAWRIHSTTATPQGPGGAFGQMGPLSVAVARVTTGDIGLSINALGTVTPLATVTVRPQVSGPIIKLPFKEGELVTAGQVLAEIDPRPYQAALDQATAQLQRDQALLANAKIDLERYKMLVAENSGTQQQYDTQQALVHQYQAGIAADRATVETAQINRNYCRITAPVAGRVGLRQMDIGNLVQANATTGIVVVTQLQPISVLFSLPEDNLQALLQRVANGAKLRVDAYDRGQTRKLASGMLATLDNEIDTSTGTLKLRALFDNKNAELFPNQFVNTRLLLDTLHDQTVVPGVAIQNGASGTYVYVVNKDQTVGMRLVTTGASDGDRVAITKGLSPGDTVVVDGADQLHDGAKVAIPNVKPQSIAAPVGGTPAQAEGGDNGRILGKLMHKLTPDERAQLGGKSREERAAWLKQHADELIKRKDQPRGRGDRGPQ
jgi:multidrug efflux system membrane fusion protein